MQQLQSRGHSQTLSVLLPLMVEDLRRPNSGVQAMVPGLLSFALADLEKCLLEGIDSYVVFEDDAGFVPTRGIHLEAYVRELPEDWGLAYLGGQHLYAAKHPPKEDQRSSLPTLTTSSYACIHGARSRNDEGTLSSPQLE